MGVILTAYKSWDDPPSSQLLEQLSPEPSPDLPESDMQIELQRCPSWPDTQRLPVGGANGDTWCKQVLCVCIWYWPGTRIKQPF